MNQKKLLKIPLTIVFGIFLVLAQSACVWSGYGRLDRDSSVSTAFAENNFETDFQFYYNGRINQPYAIIGIREGYEFRSRFWTPIESSSETFEKMVRHPYGFQQYPPYGAHILDSSGNRIGIWYSAFDFTTIQVTEDRKVYVKSPYSPNDIMRPLK